MVSNTLFSDKCVLRPNIKSNWLVSKNINLLKWSVITYPKSFSYIQNDIWNNYDIWTINLRNKMFHISNMKTYCTTSFDIWKNSLWNLKQLLDICGTIKQNESELEHIIFCFLPDVILHFAEHPIKIGHVSTKLWPIERL